MRHGQARNLLSEYALGLLALDELRDLERHLLNCQGCTLETDALTYAVGGLAAIGAIDPALLHIAMPVPAMPPGTLARIGDLVAGSLSLGPDALDPTSLMEHEADLGWPAATVAAGAVTQERWGFSSDDDLAARQLEQLAGGDGEPFAEEQDHDVALYASALAAPTPGLNGEAAPNGGSTWPWGTSAAQPSPAWEGSDEGDSEDVWAELARSSAAPNRGWQNQPAPVEELGGSFAGDWSGTPGDQQAAEAADLADETPEDHVEAADLSEDTPVDHAEAADLAAIEAEPDAEPEELPDVAALESFTAPGAAEFDDADEELPHDEWATLAATTAAPVSEQPLAAAVSERLEEAPDFNVQAPEELTPVDEGPDQADELRPVDEGPGDQADEPEPAEDVPADEWSLLAGAKVVADESTAETASQDDEGEPAEAEPDESRAGEIAVAAVLAPVAIGVTAKRGFFDRFRRAKPDASGTPEVPDLAVAAAAAAGATAIVSDRMDEAASPAASADLAEGAETNEWAALAFEAAAPPPSEDLQAVQPHGFVSEPVAEPVPAELSGDIALEDGPDVALHDEPTGAIESPEQAALLGRFRAPHAADEQAPSATEPDAEAEAESTEEAVSEAPSLETALVTGELEESGKEPERTGEDDAASVPTDDLAAATVEGESATAESATAESATAEPAPEETDLPLPAVLAAATVAIPAASRRRFGWLRREKEPEPEEAVLDDDWAALAAPPAAALPVADAGGEPGLQPDVPDVDEPVAAVAEFAAAAPSDASPPDLVEQAAGQDEPALAQALDVPEPAEDAATTEPPAASPEPEAVALGAPLEAPAVEQAAPGDQAPAAEDAPEHAAVRAAEAAGGLAAGLAAKELVAAAGDGTESSETDAGGRGLSDGEVPAAAAAQSRRFGWLRRQRHPEPEPAEAAADDWADLASAEQPPAAMPEPGEAPATDAPAQASGQQEAPAAAAAIAAASIAAGTAASADTPARPRREPATPPEPPGEFEQELRELAGEEPPRPATPARLHREPRRRGPLARMLGGQDDDDFDDDPRALTSLDEELRRVSRSATSVAGRPGFSPAYIPGPVEWGLESYADDDDEDDEESDEARVSSTWRYWALMFAAVSAVLFGIMVAGYFVLRDLNTESQGLDGTTDGGGSGGIAVAVTFIPLDTETELNLRGDGFVQPGADAILQFGGLPPIISGQRYVLWAENGEGVVTRLADRLPLGGSSTQYFSVPRVPSDVEILFLTVEQQVDGETPDLPVGDRLLEAEVP